MAEDYAQKQGSLQPGRYRDIGTVSLLVWLSLLLANVLELAIGAMSHGDDGGGEVLNYQ